MYFMTCVYFGLEGEVKAKSTNAYTSIDEAEQQFHTAMASAISKTDTYNGMIAMVFDEEGTIKFRRIWKRGQ